MKIRLLGTPAECAAADALATRDRDEVANG